MSSASNLTSVALKFSVILDGVTDLGMTTTPRWRGKPIHTCFETNGNINLIKLYVHAVYFRIT